MLLRGNNCCPSLSWLCLARSLLTLQFCLKFILIVGAPESSRSREALAPLRTDELLDLKQDVLLFTTTLADLYIKFTTTLEISDTTRNALRDLDALALDFFKKASNRNALLSHISALSRKLEMKETDLVVDWVEKMPKSIFPSKNIAEILNPIRNVMLLRTLKAAILNKTSKDRVTNQELVEIANLVCKHYHYGVNVVQSDFETIENLYLSKLIYAYKMILGRLPLITIETCGALMQHYYLAHVCGNIAKYPNYAQILDQVANEEKFRVSTPGIQAVQLKAIDLKAITDITYDEILRFNQQAKRTIQKLLKFPMTTKWKPIRWSYYRWVDFIEFYLLHKSGIDSNNQRHLSYDDLGYNIIRANLIYTSTFEEPVKQLQDQPSALHHTTHLSERDNEISGDNILNADLLHTPWLLEPKDVRIPEIFNPRTNHELNEILLDSLNDPEGKKFGDLAQKSEAYRWGGGLCTRLNSSKEVKQLINKARKLIRDVAWWADVKNAVIQRWQNLSVLDVMFLHQLCSNLLKYPISD